MQVGEVESKCLARSKDYFEWCGNSPTQQIIATFIPTGNQQIFPPDELVEQAIQEVQSQEAASDDLEPSEDLTVEPKPQVDSKVGVASSICF
eukprot:761254-Hanusia_phi.AAC.7